MHKQSYVHGASPIALRGETIGTNFDNTVARFPDKDALIVRHQKVRWSYRELQKRVNDFAAGLLALGLEPGDRVGIWSPNCSEWVITQYATAKCGLILVNINPAYRLSELEYALKTVQAKALILASTFKTSNYLEMINSLVPEIAQSTPGNIRAKILPHLKFLIQTGDEPLPGMFRFKEVLELAHEKDHARLVIIAQSLQFDSPINIQFTSGTTGTPKGATLTHFNILNNGFFVGEAMKFSEIDRLCIPVPLYHCFGMVLGNLACTTHGAAMIYPAEGFDPVSTLESIQREHCTALHGVPTMFIAELDHSGFRDFRLDTLRTGIMAGAPCPIEVMKRVMDQMHMSEITIAYGMTETSPVSFQSSTKDDVEKRVTTVGRIQPHAEAKIIDAHGNVVPIGTVGELLTRGYLVMQGYWGNKERTREVIDEAGWMHTGDLAVIDDQGYCSVVGRLKDMIIRGGENIYPREIEEYLYTHPHILDVQVFGVPDEKLGEVVCAWIRPAPDQSLTAEDIYNYCKEHIAHYKIPKHIRMVTEYPMTVTGKIQKFKMKEAMIGELKGSGT